MQYKVSKLIGPVGAEKGWEGIEETNRVELRNDSEEIRVNIDREEAEIYIQGGGSVILIRENKIARLANKVKGKIKTGDKIWLLSQEAESEFNKNIRENFEGATIVIEIPGEEVEKKQEIFVKERAFFQERNNKSVNLILGLVVFLLLIVGTFLGYQKRTEAEQKKKFEEIKSGVEEKIKEIEGVRTLNIETALELARNAESITNNAGVAEKRYFQELAELRNKITEIKKSLGGENTEYEVAYDTSLIKEGEDLFKGMAVGGGVAYLWSQSLGQVNAVDPNLKSMEKIISDERIKTWLGIFNNGEKWYGYNQNKIYEIKRNELTETEIGGVATVGEMTGWNGLTYVLDNGNQNIMKLNEGEGKKWLKEETVLAEEMTGMSIDSSIWVLGKSGKIYRYNRGVEEKFAMSALTSQSFAKSLKTSEQVNFLAYVTDENTVVIYGKDGKILGKYNFGERKINDIGIENQNKAVLVLAKNGKIYRIRIK
ncbi:MAG: hypothetical protein US68_C0010G0017 [Candidatus Shapirobacteria bacterium GW2011_GWE1_38_10]|uniref:Uncharacterized protein n=1 Tax=Candidatus Shapirobacteria bacterium GW2011_GWE1_38_10 TaxID=1618488 RepID=A0A0G0KL22_9BACT|nr:MAG: hypothetical protein US68_C0010G0017 [Candidatus Shapirobacteria bacterium GW2011_GWE1_38_10]KKQ64182.1 MAG: hypothetical protein US85_C0012G0013 [Candidatus Shapirobacteria bacterium GW2011_GWF1_38_23]HBP50728.1 hypothetical protein [Candidatus Shapirobacteria bacterium]